MYEYFETSTMLVREKKSLPYNAESCMIENPEMAADLFVKGLRLGDKPQEEVWVVYLNQKNSIAGLSMISRGSVASATVNMPDIFRSAILANASRIILAHNHPSGVPEPSFEDSELTKRIRDAGKLLSIELLDHIIIGNESTFSFRESTDLLI